MYKLTKQIGGFFGQMIQIVNWSDLLDRAFRPVIKANQSGLVMYGHLCSPVYLPGQSALPFHPMSDRTGR